MNWIPASAGMTVTREVGLFIKPTIFDMGPVFFYSLPFFPDRPRDAADDGVNNNRITRNMLFKIRHMLTMFMLNLFLGLLCLLVYPLLLLFLPTRIPERVLKFQGDMTYWLNGRQRTKVRKYLDARLGGDYTADEIDRIARDYVRIQTSFFYYTFFLVFFRKKSWLSRFVTYEGLEHLDRSLADGRGVIMPTFHYNHPLAVPGFLEFKGYRITGYAIHPWDLNVPLVAKLVARLGYLGAVLKGDVEMAYNNRGAREIYLRRLAQDVSFVVLLDMPFPGKKDLKPVDFVGEPFLFPSGIIEIIYETGRPVHIAHSVRDVDDWMRTKFVVSPEIEMTGDPDRDLQAIISAHAKVVMSHPEQWWGWANYERGTLAYHEEYRRRMEAEQKGDAEQ